MRQKSELRDAQQKIATEIFERDNLMVVVPMGGGKTAATLTAIKEMIEERHIHCAIVIAPKKVANMVWPRETKEWEHLFDMRIVPVTGTPKERTKKLLHTPADVYVVGVDNTQWLVNVLKPLPSNMSFFDMLVIDEVSRFKDPRGKRLRALIGIADRWKVKVGLTGTPRPNGYMDLWAPLNLLTDHKAYGKSFDKWKRNNFYPTDYNGYNWVVRPDKEEEIKEKAARYSCTISEMPDLPPFNEVFHWIELPEEARKSYNTMERELVAEHWDGENERWIDAANAAVATGKLEQITQGFMYDREYDEEGKLIREGDPVKVHTEKLDLWRELIANMDGSNSLTCYWHGHDLELLQKDGPFPYLGAGTKDKDDQEFQDNWNAGEMPVGLLHPASAGHGLNLQFGGNQMIFYCLPWSQEIYSQTVARIVRPGQKLPTFGHMIMVRDTVDEVKHARLTMKITEEEAYRAYLRKKGEEK